MQDNKKKFQTSWRYLQQVGKILIVIMLLTGITSVTASAEENKSSNILTVFHIYSDGQYIGGISDETKLEQMKKDMLKKASSEFENLPLTIGTNLSIVPERVFAIGTDDEVVLGKLHELLTVEAEAVGIKIDDELELYVQDQAAFDEVIRTLKLQSVSEQELIEFEELEASKKAIPPLKENETRIVEIIMSADIEATEEQVEPSDVLTVDEAVKYLNKGTLEEKKYVVQSGDVLGKIANEHGMPTAKLLELNPNITDDTIIKPGDEVNVTILEPFIEVEAHFESKKKETISYKKTTQNDDSLYKGDKKVTQKGSDGEKVVTELIRKRNGKIISKSIEEEKVLVEAKDEVTVVGTKVIPSRGVGSFKWPTVGGYVSSHMGMRWGRMHRGIDIAQPTNRTIMAADNGVVVSAGSHETYGNKIVIDHNNGYQTLYAHLSSIDVKVGQTVSQGTKIGVMGSTGRSTGVHLHFEVTKNGSLVNPMSVLK